MTPSDGPSSSPVAAPPPPPLSPSVESTLQTLLTRPIQERVREYRYRFAQTAVFGLPILGLQWFGFALGGEDSPRWVGLMQALLAGWIWYVGAAGMLFESALLFVFRRTICIDGLVALSAGVVYLLSLGSWILLLVPGQSLRGWMGFHWVPLIIGLCTGIQWWRCSERVK